MRPATSKVCLKGMRDRFGPSLEHAPQVVYIGRAMYQGGWRLPASPFANPYRVQRARRELTGKRLACFCTSGPCHAAVLAQVVDADARDLPRVLGGPFLATDGEAA